MNPQLFGWLLISIAVILLWFYLPVRKHRNFDSRISYAEQKYEKSKDSSAPVLQGFEVLGQKMWEKKSPYVAVIITCFLIALLLIFTPDKI